MASKRWIVLIDWVDGDVSDSDEVSVMAESGAHAVKKALARWIPKTHAKWPHCSVEKIEAMTAARMRRFA
jgi:hypothetical protein